MKVTPTKKKFGKYAVGDVFELPPKTARVFIKVGKLAAVAEVELPPLHHSGLYQNRMMAADKAARIGPAVVEVAPYGYKADGTPRLRPGRPAKSE